MKPPIELRKDELQVWDKVIELVDDENLKGIHLMTLANYCQEKARFYRLHQQVLDLGGNEYVEGQKGGMYVHPVVSMRNTASKMCTDIEKLFGFNPKGEKDLQKPEKQEQAQSKILQLINKGGIKKAK